jgi:hypothetical protein
VTRRLADEVAEGDGDLGFSFTTRKNGDVVIAHHGRDATTLRGRQARSFLAVCETADARTVQQRMARLTGNYKRGNERSTRERGEGR